MAEELTRREMVVYKNVLRELAPEAVLTEIDEASPWALEAAFALDFVRRRRTDPGLTLDALLDEDVTKEAVAPAPKAGSKPKTSKRTARSPSSTAGRSTTSAA